MAARSTASGERRGVPHFFEDGVARARLLGAGVEFRRTR